VKLTIALFCIVKQAQVFGPAALFRGIIFTGFWVTPYMVNMNQEKRDAFFARVMDLLEKKVIVPFSGRKFPLAQVKEAVAASGEVGRGGKILLVSE
jgi:NADPH:quinone reductase-like Zn-dependent oxidoreductase